jgi:transcriptional regulator GlxA family with amidase domain
MKRLGIVTFPGFQILDLAAVGVFEVANLLGDRKTYDVALLSEDVAQRRTGPMPATCNVVTRRSRSKKTAYS